jgi:hypothetical protein
MGIKLSNNANATLATGINSSATSITLTSGQGARFPTLGAGDFFYATLIDTSNNLEIVKCTARSTDVLTVVRAQESTTARAYNTGDRIEIRLTAQTFIDAVNEIGPTQVSDEANTSTGYFQLPRGTTAQRPASPATGMVRFNTELNYIEEYRSGQWIAVSNVFAASGGTETIVNVGGTNYKVHTFTTSGTFTVQSGTASVEYLIVAGGGGGGSEHGGGGGAGGRLTGTTSLITAAYPITIGAGGNGAAYSASNGAYLLGTNGANSTALSLTAVGGGYGASYRNGATSQGNSGGSGGGGGAYDSGGSSGGSGTSGQGNAGGRGTVSGSPYTAGGGGGAGAAGSDSTGSVGGPGGIGVQSSISGTATYYAGGGGGAGAVGATVSTAGGLGGGGASGNINSYGGVAGTANTGGGGGGSYDNLGAASTGGNGGSGIVIIRYQI